MADNCKKSKRKKSNPSRIPQMENTPEVKKLLLIENKILSISDELDNGTAKETLIECRNIERSADREALNNNLNKSALYGPPYVCIVCKQWFLSKEKLLMHYIVNHQKVPCQLCLLVFEDDSALLHHQQKAHCPLLCELCKQSFENARNLNEHYESNHQIVSCRFCGLLIQPVSCYSLHINRKHNVHENYCRDENLEIVDDWHQEWNFRCRMCNKNRPKKDLYGHFRMYHKVTAIAMVNLVVTEKFEFKMNGSIDEVIPIRKPILEISVKSEPIDADGGCNSCSGNFTRVPWIFHQIYCFKKHGCKFCFETFDDKYQLHYHRETKHKLFQCALGCTNIASPNERELHIHYKKFHDIVACKFCDIFVSADQQKYDMHLINEHAIKDYIVEEVYDLDLFMEKTSRNSKTITCCLCDRNLTEMMSCVETVYGHYTDKHSIILKAIIGFNQSNPFSMVKTPELPMSLGKFDFDANDTNDGAGENENINGVGGVGAGHSDEDDEKDGEIHAEVIEDVNPEHVECVINEGSSDEDDSIDPSLLEVKIKEEPLEEDDDDGAEVFNIDLNRFTCDLCEMKFLTKSELLEHSQIFHGFNAKLPLLTCGDCCETFTNESNLELHLINVHGKNLDRDANVNVKCSFCNLISFKKHIRYHVQKEHLEEIAEIQCLDSLVGYKCNFCTTLLWTQWERNTHEIKEHYSDALKNIFKCYVCFKEFTRKFCLRKHVESTHTLEQKFLSQKMSYKCLQCSVLLPRLEQAREHFMTQHPQEFIYRCSFMGCNVRNKSKDVLDDHIKTSHARPKMEYVLFKPKPCEICGKFLSSQKSAKIHYRMKHTGERIGYGCRLCSERFDTIEKRKLHYAIAHTGLRAYICSVCGKGFNSKSGLYGHKQLHNNFSFECEYCHKIFIRKDTYNEHILIHSGPRHQCQYCPRAFTQRSNLIRHTRIHTGEKPYQCPMCPKRFSDKGACNSHVRVHTREEECSCPFCGKTYSKKQKLKYHLKKHTGEEQATTQDSGGNKTFICSECKQTFTDEKYLRRHIITTHFEVACNYKCQLCGQKFITQNHLNSHILSHSGVKHSQCLLCEAAYASEDNIIQHLREVHKITDDKDIENYFKQNTAFDEVTDVIRIPNMENRASDKTIIFSDRKQTSPDPLKAASSSKLRQKSPKKPTSIAGGGNKRRNKSKQYSEYDDDDQEFFDEYVQQTMSTKSRQVKKPKRYIEETEMFVNVDKFLQVQINGESNVQSSLDKDDK